MHDHEMSIIKTFFKPEKYDRYITLLSSKKRRLKALNALNHLHDLNLKYATEIGSNYEDAIIRLLKSKGAPENCYVISDNPDIDGKDMSLKEAIERAEEKGFGTIIGCIPGKLAYYYGEDGEQRLLLEK